MPFIQILLIILIVFIVLGVGAGVMINREQAKTRRMMRVIRGRSGDAAVKSEKGKGDQRRAEIAKKLKDSHKNEDRNKKKPTVALMIEQAGLALPVKFFWVLSVVLMLVLVMLAKMMGQPPHILILAAIIGLLGLPRFILKKAAKRQKKFLEEFPDALEATVRLLKAGMPVSEAVSMISREFEGPVGEEMSRIYDKQKIGVPLHEAALEATKRMPLPEMQMFATGLAIQAQTGSSLSEVLMNLSNVIRARFRLKRKIKALSSEAIASAGIIASLPVLVATGMYFTNYEYISVLFTDSFGKILLTGAIVWMGIGVFMMKAMINFKI